VKAWFRSLPQLGDRLLAFVICTGPNSKADTIKSLSRVLLDDKRVGSTRRLVLGRNNLDIVWEGGLQLLAFRIGKKTRTRIAE
jgi:hypothetical protein